MIPLQLWQLKKKFDDILINFNKFSRKTLRIAAFLRLEFRMFYSITIDRKKL